MTELIEALRYYRDMARNNKVWPIVYSFADDQYHCRDCGAVAYGKSDLIHVAACPHEAMEKVYREAVKAEGRGGHDWADQTSDYPGAPVGRSAGP